MPDASEGKYVSFTRILLPLDGSSIAEEAVAHAKLVAKRCNAEVHLLHVQKSLSHFDQQHVDPVDWRIHRAELSSYLSRLSERLSAEDIKVSVIIREGRPAEQIVEYSEEVGIDLIVLTAYGKGGVSRFHFGSTAQKVISGSGTSLLIVRPGEFPSNEEVEGYQRILISMDGSPRSEWVACQVAALMRGQPVELVLLQVIAVPEMPRRMPITREEHATREKFIECNRRAAQAYLEEIAHQLSNGIKVHSRLLVAANVAESIYAVANEENVDLIALSAHESQTGAHRVIGTVCQTVMSHCNRPVLVFQELKNVNAKRRQLEFDACRMPQAVHSGDSGSL